MIKPRKFTSLKVKNWEIAKTKFDVRCLIVSDLDGTLLDHRSSISAYTRKVVKALTEKGHVFCIFTARPERTSLHFYNQLGLKTPIVNYNGARIFNPSNPNFLSIDHSINNEIIYKIFSDEKVRKLTDNVIMETPDGTFFLYRFKEGMTEKEVRQSLAQFNIYATDNITIMNGKLKVLEHGPYALLVSLNDMSTAKEFAERVTAACKSVVVRGWSEKHVGVIIEINSSFPSKGMALKLLSTYYDIPLSRCYAFGDNENDTGMILTAGNGYAMKNADKVVKKIAPKITKYPNSKQGVARELNKIFKLGIEYEEDEEKVELQKLNIVDAKTQK